MNKKKNLKQAHERAVKSVLGLFDGAIIGREGITVPEKNRREYSAAMDNLERAQKKAARNKKTTHP